MPSTVAAFLLDPADNVATLPWGGARGDAVDLRGAASPQVAPVLSEDIPPGHKCALRPIAAGGEVLKYGAGIGRARCAIDAGRHVHVHNLQSRLAPDAGGNAPAATAQGSRVPMDALERTVAALLQQAGASGQAAQDVAAHLVAAEASGVGTHGVRRLAPLLRRLRAGGVAGNAPPVIDRRGVILSVDGRDGPGQHVARIAADAVAALARTEGAAVALVRASSHFGYAGFYASRIAAAGMVGIAVSNGQVLVGPPGALRPIFSNDPVALAAPIADGPPFEFDMATSVTSRARIAQAAEAGQPIATGLALDAEGRPTVIAAEALRGILLPLGGAKGFGLIAALEVLAGVLPGGAYADQVISKEASDATPEGTSHFLMAISPEFAGGADVFAARMADLSERVRGLPMAAGAPAARLPGARRAALRAEAERDGILLDDAVLRALASLAAEAGITPEYSA